LNIIKDIAREIENFGEKITVTSEKGEFSIKGILEPLLYKNKMYFYGKQVPTGFFDIGHYLLICPYYVELPVLGTVFFESKKGRFILKRSETVKAKSKPVYVWAVLAPYVEPEEEEL